MFENKTIRLNFVPQLLIKFLLFSFAFFICDRVFCIFSSDNLSVRSEFFVTLSEALVLSILLTGIQILFLTDCIIKALSLFYRCIITLLFSETLVVSLGISFGWFSINLTFILLFFVIFTSVFTIGVLTLLKLQSYNTTGFHGIIILLLSRIRKTALALLTAYIIGFSAGFRGQSESYRIWQQQKMTITELNNSCSDDEYSKDSGIDE